MKFISYEFNGETGFGLLLDNRIIDLVASYRKFVMKPGKATNLHGAHPAFPRDMISFLREGSPAFAAAQQVSDIISAQIHIESSMFLSTNKVMFLPPINDPGKIICIGLNYPEVNENPRSPAQKYPVIFLKPASSLSGHGQSIQIPSIAREVLYEGELALVIGKRGKNIRRELALDHIAGYTIANDVGAHDLEQRTSQWTSGKISDTFCPLGPALVTSDEILDPNKLTIKTTLNKQVVQYGSTDEMIFDVPYLISYVSELTTLEVGDLILTGSPKRVGEQQDPRISLKPGDTISIEIEKLGALTNPVQADEV